MKTMTAPKLDAVLAGAVDLARAAAVEVGGDTVGEHLAVHPDGERVVTHAFACTLPGYTGWYWAVTLARPPRGKMATVDEVVLLPGADALLAPAWVPWQRAAAARAISAPATCCRPTRTTRALVPAYVQSDDPAVEEVAFELGLGRARVMSREGRLDTADALVRRRRGPGHPDGPAGAGALRDVRVPPAAGRIAAAGVRRVRQRDHRRGRPGGQRRVRLRRALRGRSWCRRCPNRARRSTTTGTKSPTTDSEVRANDQPIRPSRRCLSMSGQPTTPSSQPARHVHSQSRWWCCAEPRQKSSSTTNAEEEQRRPDRDDRSRIGLGGSGTHRLSVASESAALGHSRRNHAVR